MKITLLILLAFFISCSTTIKQEEPMVPVPMDASVEEKGPIIVEEDEDISTPTFDATANSVSTKKPILALIFGPGLNRTAGYSAFLKQLKKQNITAQMVSGSGMGAVVAAHYAAGKTPQKMEWLFYKFFNETRGKKPFSNSWLRSLEEVLLKEFRNSQIQDLKIKLVIPVYQKNPPGIKNFDQGNIFELLQAQFIFSPKSNSHYISPMESQVFNGFWMRKLGAELVVGVDALGGKILFDQPNEFLKNHYAKVLKTMKKEKKYLDLYFSLPFSKMPLDSEKNLPESLQKTNEYGKWAASVIKSKRGLRKTDEEQD